MIVISTPKGQNKFRNVSLVTKDLRQTFAFSDPPFISYQILLNRLAEFREGQMPTNGEASSIISRKFYLFWAQRASTMR